MINFSKTKHAEVPDKHKKKKGKQSHPKSYFDI